MSLLNIQHAFHHAVYGADDTRLGALISDSDDFPAHERIQVYRNNTLGALKDVVRSTYPLSQQLVGGQYFDQLARHFVTHKPSDQPNLDLYGAGFADCLDSLVKQRPELDQLGYLPDIARLEWALHQSYYAQNRADFDFAGFALLSSEQQAGVCFALAADIFLLDSDYPVYSIWRQHQSDEPGAHVFAVADDRGYVAVARDEFKPVAIPISADLYRLLHAIQQPCRLAEWGDLLAHTPALLQRLIQHGWIVSYRVSEPC